LPPESTAVRWAVVVPLVEGWETLNVDVGEPSMPDSLVRRPFWSAGVVVAAST